MCFCLCICIVSSYFWYEFRDGMEKFLFFDKRYWNIGVYWVFSLHLLFYTHICLVLHWYMSCFTPIYVLFTIRENAHIHQICSKSRVKVGILKGRGSHKVSEKVAKGVRGGSRIEIKSCKFNINIIFAQGRLPLTATLPTHASCASAKLKKVQV